MLATIECPHCKCVNLVPAFDGNAETVACIACKGAYIITKKAAGKYAAEVV